MCEGLLMIQHQRWDHAASSSMRMLDQLVEESKHAVAP